MKQLLVRVHDELDGAEMRSESWRWLLAVCALLIMSCPNSSEAKTEVDQCAHGAVGAPPTALRVRTRLRLDRDTAISIIKHVQRACLLLDALEKQSEAKEHAGAMGRFRRVSTKLETRVLDPIYRIHPALRGAVSSSAQEPASPKCDRSTCPGQVTTGPRTATYLRWTLADAANTFPVKLEDRDCGTAPIKDCFRTIADIDSELGFAAIPLVKDYPDLWRVTLREDRKRTSRLEIRTPASDAAFQTSAPRDPIEMTPAALKRVREFLVSLHREDPSECVIASIGWTLGGESKGPDDADWKKHDPGLVLGAFACRQVPPNVIRSIGGIRIILQGDKPDRFAGKLVDYRNRQFVLEPH